MSGDKSTSDSAQTGVEIAASAEVTTDTESHEVEVTGRAPNGLDGVSPDQPVSLTAASADGSVDQEVDIESFTLNPQPDGKFVDPTVEITHTGDSGILVWVAAYDGDANADKDSVTIYETIAAGFLQPGWTHTLDVEGSLLWLNTPPRFAVTFDDATDDGGGSDGDTDADDERDADSDDSETGDDSETDDDSDTDDGGGWRDRNNWADDLNE